MLRLHEVPIFSVNCARASFPSTIFSTMMNRPPVSLSHSVPMTRFSAVSGQFGQLYSFAFRFGELPAVVLQQFTLFFVGDFFAGEVGDNASRQLAVFGDNSAVRSPARPKNALPHLLDIFSGDALRQGVQPFARFSVAHIGGSTRQAQKGENQTFLGTGLPSRFVLRISQRFSSPDSSGSLSASANTSICSSNISHTSRILWR